MLGLETFWNLFPLWDHGTNQQNHAKPRTLRDANHWSFGTLWNASGPSSKRKSRKTKAKADPVIGPIHFRLFEGHHYYRLEAIAGVELLLSRLTGPQPFRRKEVSKKHRCTRLPELSHLARFQATVGTWPPRRRTHQYDHMSPIEARPVWSARTVTVGQVACWWRGRGCWGSAAASNEAKSSPAPATGASLLSRSAAQVASVGGGGWMDGGERSGWV